MMNYTFPEINHIDDVIPHIEDRPEFKVMDKGWYTVINYMVAFEDTFSLIRERSHYNMWVRRECRGLIFNTATGELISRPYHKFFNVGEREETSINKINLYEPHVVLEKLDGSMIRPIPTPEGFRLGTKAGITDVAMNAEYFIADKKHYSQFIHKCFQRNITPIFEWCSRKNRIVVDYPEDQLILTGMRDKTTGCYVYYDAMLKYATAWCIPVVNAVDGLAVQNIDLFVKQVREWDDGEGVVIRFDNGHMVKVKADEYILRHRSKEQINSEKNIIQVILNDAVDDMIPLLTEDDATRLRKFQSEFWSAVDEVAQDLTTIFEGGDKMYPDKKEFAVEFVNRMILPMHRPFMFGMKQGKECKQLLIDSIEKSLSSQTKLNDSRWMFGGISWN
jgi:RNA ligase